MTSLAFILGVVPLAMAVGAGAEMRRALGIAVFSGMLGVTAVRHPSDAGVLLRRRAADGVEAGRSRLTVMCPAQHPRWQLMDRRCGINWCNGPATDRYFESESMKGDHAMANVDTLLKRIDAEFSALEERIKQAQAEQVHEHQERQKRLAAFEKLLAELPAVWQPRLEALTQKFGDKVKVTPKVTSSSREGTFEFPVEPGADSPAAFRLDRPRGSQAGARLQPGNPADSHAVRFAPAGRVAAGRRRSPGDRQLDRRPAGRLREDLLVAAPESSTT